MAAPHGHTPTLLGLPLGIRKVILLLASTYSNSDGEPQPLQLKNLQIRRNTFGTLLRVNRQINAEAAEYTFRYNMVWLKATGMERENDSSKFFSSLQINGAVVKYCSHTETPSRGGPAFRKCLRIELPSYSIRPRIEQLRVTLTVPEDSSLEYTLRLFGTPLYKSDQVDWLWPIMSLAANNFGTLQLLEVEVKSDDKFTAAKFTAEELAELKRWTNRRVADSLIDADTITVEYNVKR